MDAVLKALLYLGLLLSLGGGFFLLFVHDPRTAAPGAWRSSAVPMAIGAAVVLIITPLEVRSSLLRLFGQFDPWLGVEYLQMTRHGNALAWRLLVPLAAVVPFLPAPLTARRILFGGLALTFLGISSAVSHSAALTGTGGWILDGTHYVGAIAWAGAVGFAALSWRRMTVEGRAATMRNVSRAGLISVVVITASALPLALLHISGPERLVGSGYGLLVILKSVLFGAALVMAFINRRTLVAAAGGVAGLGGTPVALTVESVLIAGVLIVTGALSTTQPPHEPGVVPDLMEHLRNFLSLVLR